LSHSVRDANTILALSGLVALSWAPSAGAEKRLGRDYTQFGVGFTEFGYEQLDDTVKLMYRLYGIGNMNFTPYMDARLTFEYGIAQGHFQDEEGGNDSSSKFISGGVHLRFFTTLRDTIHPYVSIGANVAKVDLIITDSNEIDDQTEPGFEGHLGAEFEFLDDFLATGDFSYILINGDHATGAGGSLGYWLNETVILDTSLNLGFEEQDVTAGLGFTLAF
jgi:hypothetical protein